MPAKEMRFIFCLKRDKEKFAAYTFKIDAICMYIKMFLVEMEDQRAQKRWITSLQ